MDWRTMLVLIASGLVLILVLVTYLMVRSRNKQIIKLGVEVERWKGLAERHRDEVVRLLDQIAHEGLSNEEAIEKINEYLFGWNAIDGNNSSNGKRTGEETNPDIRPVAAVP